jgi:p-cumate 2,3-dioxygenase alpha subunit
MLASHAPFVVENRAEDTFLINREVFVSDEVMKLEWKRIFDTCWIYVGHTSEVPNPGDFKTRHVAARPIIFCRDLEGQVRAMLNVCSHRGAMVCREREGNAKGFYCMYHGWTFKPDGSLLSAPGIEDYGPKFDRAAHALRPVPRFESYRDFWFLCFDADAPSLHDYLGGARDYIDLVVDQSPSGKMEIITGTQEYDIRANWKLLVENSVDDYHIIATHTTWIQYMINSGVNMKRPRGQLLPSKGKGLDLGNGHLTIDNPNYRGRPVAAWISVYGEEAKEDIARVKAELVERLGPERAERVSNTNRNLVIFPNLVINDGSSVTVRNFTPVSADRMKVTAWALGTAEETKEQRARRLHAFLTFYGPGGFATPDDVAALESAQECYAAHKDTHWNDLSRGMHKPDDQQLDTDEGHTRCFWRRWSQLVEA